MMTQMAPMLEMMKAKMGKRRFAMMMQTMGPDDERHDGTAVVAVSAAWAE
jgi:hypothetical protein